MLAYHAVLFVLSIALLVRAVVDPHAALHGYRGPGSVVVAAFLIPLIVYYAPRAWRARPRERG